MATHAQKKSARDRFNAGSTIEQIADEYGVHPRTVYKWATAGGWSSTARDGAALDLDTMPKTIDEAVEALEQATFVAIGILQQDALTGNIGNGHQHMRFARALEWLHHMKQRMALDAGEEHGDETDHRAYLDALLIERLGGVKE